MTGGRRKYQRTEVNWNSNAAVGASAISGTVKDISKGGLFLEVEAAYLDGELLTGEDILSHLEIGDAIDVDVQGKPQVGYIQWMGLKKNSPGVGLQFKVPDRWGVVAGALAMAA